MSSSADAGMVSATAANGVAYVTISNPAKRNAISTSMMASLDTLLPQLDADPQVRVIVIRGDGTVAFAAGADISEFERQQADAENRAAADETVARLFATLDELRKPLVAMIYGYCLGAGVAVALGADFRIAAQGARFSIPAARLGIGYPVALTHALVRTIGRARAAEVLFTGKTLTSAEALDAGFVNRVVPDAALGHYVDDLASTIARNAPLSVRAAKAAIRSTTDHERRAEAEDLVRACANSSDAREGQRAFVENREARFAGA